MKYFLISFLLILFSFTWSEFHSGFLTQLYIYNFSDLDSEVEGEIIKSKWRQGKFLKNSYYVKYTYQVDGRTFIGTLVNFKAPSDGADEVLNSYPLGKLVTVFYDTASPEHAVLEKTSLGFKNWTHIFLIIVVIPSMVFLYSKLVKNI